jgi:hypothetical protein
MGYIRSSDLKGRRNETISENYTEWYYYTPEHELADSDDQILSSRNITRFRGFDTPNFHTRLKAGELIPHTPYEYFHSEGQSVGTKNINGHYSVGNYAGFQDWILIEDELRAHVPPTGSEWIQEAAAAIYSSGWDALTFVAELADVKRMFVGAIGTFKKLLSLHGWKKLSAHDEYLSVRYGWRTLMYDIKDINELLAKTKSKREVLSEQRGTKSTTHNVTEVSTSFYYYNINRITTDSITVHTRGSVDALIDVPDVLINPIATAWEVVPLSFVVDWFFTVGRAIEAASFAALEKSYTASYGHKVEIVRGFQTEFTSKDGYESGTHTQNGSSKAVFSVRVPSPVPFSPHFTVKLNEYKVLDLVSLALQRR